MTITTIHIMPSITNPDPIAFNIQVCLKPGHTYNTTSFKELEDYLIKQLGTIHKSSIIEYSKLKQHELTQIASLGQQLKEAAAKNDEIRFKKLDIHTNLAPTREYRALAKSCRGYADDKLKQVGNRVVDYAEQLNAHQTQFEIPHAIHFQVREGIVAFLNRSIYRCVPINPAHYYGFQDTRNRVRSSSSASL